MACHYCKCCDEKLTTPSSMHEIFGNKDDLDKNFQNFLHDYLSFSIAEHTKDNFFVCTKCFKQLRASYEFKQKCMQPPTDDSSSASDEDDAHAIQLKSSKSKAKNSNNIINLDIQVLETEQNDTSVIVIDDDDVDFCGFTNSIKDNHEYNIKIEQFDTYDDFLLKNIKIEQDLDTINEWPIVIDDDDEDFIGFELNKNQIIKELEITPLNDDIKPIIYDEHNEIYEMVIDENFFLLPFIETINLDNIKKRLLMNIPNNIVENNESKLDTINTDPLGLNDRNDGEIVNIKEEPFDFDEYWQTIIKLSHDEQKLFSPPVKCLLCESDGEIFLKNFNEFALHTYNFHYVDKRYLCILSKCCGSFENVEKLNNHLFMEHTAIIE